MAYTRILQNFFQKSSDFLKQMCYNVLKSKRREGFSMKTNYIITIARQFASGGHDIGQMLAEQLEIPFYDKELISLAAKESGMDPDVFSKVDERAANSLLYSLSMGLYSFGNGFPPWVTCL